MLSTGKIAEDISKVAIRHGWETYTAWGRFAKPSVSTQIQVGSKLDTYMHYAAHRLFDREGLMSKGATRKLVQRIEEIKPDIIHLHNIHDHYLNYPLLFEYLAKADIPVVWTQHDCWSFTGGCMYFDLLNCDAWKSGCINCPEKRAFLANSAEKQFRLKQELLSQIKSLTFVPVSKWLAGLMKQSVQGHRDIITIHNGIDLTVFKPMRGASSIKFNILGVAAVWHKRKGFDDFNRLRELLPEDFSITLVGLSPEQVKMLPPGINGITRTSNLDEMVQLYSDADVFVNPTYSDNFPTTNIEALACGTPVITYKTGGSPEAVDTKTGVVIEQGNINALADAIMNMRDYPLSSEDCRKRAEDMFDKERCFEEYIDLYNKLLNK